MQRWHSPKGMPALCCGTGELKYGVPGTPGTPCACQGGVVEFRLDPYELAHYGGAAMATRNYWLDLFTGTMWQEFLHAGAEVTGFGESRWHADRVGCFLRARLPAGVPCPSKTKLCEARTQTSRSVDLRRWASDTKYVKAS